MNNSYKPNVIGPDLEIIDRLLVHVSKGRVIDPYSGPALKMGYDGSWDGNLVQFQSLFTGDKYKLKVLRIPHVLDLMKVGTGKVARYVRYEDVPGGGREYYASEKQPDALHMVGAGMHDLVRVYRGVGETREIGYLLDAVETGDPDAAEHVAKTKNVVPTQKVHTQIMSMGLFSKKVRKDAGYRQLTASDYIRRVNKDTSDVLQFLVDEFNRTHTHIENSAYAELFPAKILDDKMVVRYSYRVAKMFSFVYMVPELGRFLDGVKEDLDPHLLKRLTEFKLSAGDGNIKDRAGKLRSMAVAMVSAKPGEAAHNLFFAGFRYALLDEQIDNTHLSQTNQCLRTMNGVKNFLKFVLVYGETDGFELVQRIFSSKRSASPAIRQMTKCYKRVLHKHREKKRAQGLNV